MGDLRRILAALCIVAMLVTGIGVAIFVVMNTLHSGNVPSSPKSSLAAPAPKLPTPEEFRVGVQVTGQQCADNGVCTYTYSIEPNYVGYHPLPEQDFTVFYEISGGNAPQPGNFTVSDGQARVFKDVTLEGPPGALLQATVTQISLVAGPKPIPTPETVPPEQLSPQPIN